MSANNLITLADARTFLGPYVDGGGTCDTAIIDLRINEASERIWPKLDLRASLRRVNALVRNNSFCLPYDVVSVLAVNTDGTPASIMSQAYEFSSAGPGDLACAVTSALTPSRNVVELGEFPTQFDPPVVRVADADGDFGNGTWDCDNYLLAFSTEIDDTTTPLTVRGLDARNDELFTNSEPGVEVPINRWTQGVEGKITNLTAAMASAKPFRQISQVYKPVTKGPVTLYAYRPATGAMFLLSKMTPEETTPTYRRFKLTGIAKPLVNADGTQTRDLCLVSMLCKVAWRRATRATDILFVQSLSALKMMCQALNFENQGVFDRAQAYETLALRILLDQKKENDAVTNVPLIIDYSRDITLAALNHGYLV